jgi:carbamoyl-phosphate synthase small subunit
LTDYAKTPAVVLLEDGTVFHGHAAGKIGTTVGEICFNTGMTGYQEIFTDPSYFGQVLVMTNAHIGNYGTLVTDVESSSAKISGLVVKNLATAYTRHQADKSLNAFLEEQQVVSISDIDTRSLVRHIRSKGAQNAIISSATIDIERLKEQLAETPQMAGLELSSKVSTRSPYAAGDKTGAYRVAVLDLGVKQNILRCLGERGCNLMIFPARTRFKELHDWEPDGIFFSNGPGDPAAMPYAVETAKAVLEADIPFFGICLGHQILGLAAGLKTYKMHHGHRGSNHAVLNLLSGRCEITTQNHGFGLLMEASRNGSGDIQVTHLNLNDNTVEGIRLRHRLAFSVQYHPESSPGPHDSRYLFDEFLKLMATAKRSRYEGAKSGVVGR